MIATFFDMSNSLLPDYPKGARINGIFLSIKKLAPTEREGTRVLYSRGTTQISDTCTQLKPLTRRTVLATIFFR